MKKYLGFIWIGIIIVTICVWFYFIREHEIKGTKLSMDEWYHLCKNFPSPEPTKEEILLCLRAERNRRISLLFIIIGIVIWLVGLLVPVFKKMKKK